MALLHNLQCHDESKLKSPNYFNPLKPRQRRKFNVQDMMMRVPEYAAARAKEAREAAATEREPMTTPPRPQPLIGGGQTAIVGPGRTFP
jgi:hypothetical protein